MQRDARGRFKPGNPGRRRGSRNRITRAVESIFEDDAKAVARALVKAAKGGDVQASIAVLRLVAPPPRGRLIELDLPTLETAADAPRAIAQIVAAVAAGRVTPSEGHELASLIGEWLRSYETQSLEERLAELELEKEQHNAYGHA